MTTLIIIVACVVIIGASRFCAGRILKWMDRPAAQRKLDKTIQEKHEFDSRNDKNPFR